MAANANPVGKIPARLAREYYPKLQILAICSLATDQYRKNGVAQSALRDLRTAPKL